MIGQTVSHYKILEKLGEGGMGVVYKAQDLKLDRPVALKFLPQPLTDNEEAKKRFVHEAKTASALDHPNICNIYEIDETPDGKMFIAMAYYEGESLRDRMERGPMDVETVLNIVSQAAMGLSKAHEKDIIHRDIKPANILITSEGVVKIVDFGLAKLEGRTKVTRTGTTVGTIAYMSPEQARSEEVDYRSDIWSLGVVLYEMLTGGCPFPGDHEAAAIYQIVSEEPLPLNRHRSDLPHELQRIVDHALKKNISERYQSISEMLADLRNLRDEVAPGGVAACVSGRPRRKLLVSALALLLVAVVLLIGIKIQIGRQPPAQAAENKLAVMYFENMADPEDTERLGDIVTNLLITDLSESRYVQVVSSQRLYDILKLLGKEGKKVIDKELASQVAGKANAKWMLLGNILQVEPQLIVTSQLVEVASGNAVASQRIRGEAGEEIFSLVDELTVEIKKDLSLPGKALNEPDRPVAEVTTHSSEAYRYYLEGVEYESKYYIAEAEESFRKAVELDSTFAMAYLKLARYSGDEQRIMIAKAVAYSDKVSQKEKRYIRSEEAFFSEDYTEYIDELQKIVELYPEEKEAYHKLGLYYLRQLQQFDKAVDYFGKAIEIDSLYKVTYNQLAYTYNRIGDFEKSIWAINKYISIAPDEANPYDTRGDLYGGNGKIDLAIESYKKALEIKPDFYSSLEKLGHMYLFKREYANAESRYNKLVTNPNKWWRSWGRTCLAFIPLYQGKLEQALEVLDDGIAADKMEQQGWDQAEKHNLKARIYEEKKNLDLALKESKKSMKSVFKEDPDGIFQWQDHYAYLLVKNGDVAMGEEILNTLKEDIEKGSPKYDWAYGYYWYTAGKIELAKGDLASAITSFNKAKKVNPRFDERFHVRFLLSGIYLELGRLGEAVAELEKALSTYNEYRAKNSVDIGKAYYLLGVAYEKSGWNKKAIEQYEEFLEMWKDADPGIPVVDDAKERLAKLKNEEQVPRQR